MGQRPFQNVRRHLCTAVRELFPVGELCRRTGRGRPAASLCVWGWGGGAGLSFLYFSRFFLPDVVPDIPSNTIPARRGFPGPDRHRLHAPVRTAAGHSTCQSSYCIQAHRHWWETFKWPMVVYRYLKWIFPLIFLHVILTYIRFTEKLKEHPARCCIFSSGFPKCNIFSHYTLLRIPSIIMFMAIF